MHINKQTHTQRNPSTHPHTAHTHAQNTKRYIYKSIYTYKCTHTYMQTHINTDIYPHKNLNAQIHIQTYTPSSTSTNIKINTHKHKKQTH